MRIRELKGELKLEWRVKRLVEVEVDWKWGTRTLVKELSNTQKFQIEIEVI